MPDHLGTWNCVNNSRNPTRSHELNDLDGHVKKKETCLQGVTSYVCHPFTDGEYQQQKTILCAPAFTNFQCHLIAHIDYVSQWQKILFQPHAIFPEFAAKAQLSWSKNVHEEHDAPWQIVLGPKPSSMCVH